MGEIRFSCERCGQQIVADASAAGLNAECPSCHLALIIPETDCLEEPDGPIVSSREHTDTQLALAYMCEQLEAAQEEGAALSANTIRVQAEIGALLVERRAHLTLIADYRGQLKAAEAQLAGAHSIPSKSPQTIPNTPREGTANMENCSERLEAELIETRVRLEELEKTSGALAGSCEELRRENAALIRALQEAKSTREPGGGGAQIERVEEDNGLLRGIVSRQNALLEQWHAELAGFKRARLTLRILYALFGLCLIILAIVAIDSWPFLKISI